MLNAQVCQVCYCPVLSTTAVLGLAYRIHERTESSLPETLIRASGKACSRAFVGLFASSRYVSGTPYPVRQRSPRKLSRQAGIRIQNAYPPPLPPPLLAVRHPRALSRGNQPGLL